MGSAAELARRTGPGDPLRMASTIHEGEGPGDSRVSPGPLLAEGNSLSVLGRHAARP